jgi:hypothetical protein
MEAKQADLGKACERLGVEKDVRELAEKILDRCANLTGEMLHSGQVGAGTSDELCAPRSVHHGLWDTFIERTLQGEEQKRLRFACLLYFSKKVRSREDQKTWGLSEILKEFDLRYVQPALLVPPNNVSIWNGAQQC